LARVEEVFVGVVVASRGLIGRGRAVVVLGGVIREALLTGVGESGTDSLGVTDLEDPGVKDVERELVAFGGAEVTLRGVVVGGVLVEFIFHGGRGGGAFFPFTVVVCCRAFGVTVDFAGVLELELSCTAPFGGGGGGRVGAGIVADRLIPI
jgi:hypothetical protein